MPLWAQEKATSRQNLIVKRPEISRAVLNVNPRLLPAGAEAHFPVLDMDPLLVTLPPQSASDLLTADMVYSDVIERVLRTVGFSNPEGRIRFPPDEGVRQPGANLRELAELLSPGANDDLQAVLTAYGMSSSDFSGDQHEILYPFQQIVDGVPVEHSFLVASRLEGETVSAVRGSLIHHYEVVNPRPPASDGNRAAELAKSAFREIAPGYSPAKEAVVGESTLVLLPHGNTRERVIALYHTWRMIFAAVRTGTDQEERFHIWVDADPQRNRILKLVPLTVPVAAKGYAWRRQPLRTPELVDFQVDPASTRGGMGPRYLLELTGVFDRLEVNDGSGTEPHWIPAPGPADFSLTVPLKPGCNPSPPGSGAFTQVSLFASLHRNWDTAIRAGLNSDLPDNPWKPTIDLLDCSLADSSLLFSACGGYFETSCPNWATAGWTWANFLNFADDNTVVAHEMGHNIVRGLTNLRPDDWCDPDGDGTDDCSTVQGFDWLHDLADAWADATAGTNCTAGWVARNQSGSAGSADCAIHWSDKLPRKHVMSWPPITPIGDRFPQSRRLTSYVNPYNDLQIPAAALWQVRNGMVSKAGALGPALYLQRLVSGLLKTGIFAYDMNEDRPDIDIYDLLWDLENQLVIAWKADASELGANTANKVTAGFAKAGIFLVPSSCIDGISETCRAGQPCNRNCPDGDHGADAVIEIEDNVREDHIELDEFIHEENDFVGTDSPTPPTFLVWSGPVYTFDANGKAIPRTGANLACNSRAKVQLSKKTTFRNATESGWIDLRAGTCPRGECFVSTCYMEWTPAPVTWQSFIRSTGGDRIYYRAETTNGAGQNSRLSTRPGHGVTVPPPYAILTRDGRRP
jgi:hypothetical protein